MAEVVLIYPPVKFGKHSSYGLPPLGVMYLSAFLTHHGVDSRVIDASFHPMSMAELVSRVGSHRPRLVGISGLTPHFKTIRDLCTALRATLPKSARICLGGPHFNATSAEAFQYMDADFIVIGEGEATLLELYGKLDEGDFSSIRGLAFKTDGQTVINAARPLNEDLDALPRPTLEQMDTKIDYKVRHGVHPRATSLMASRGCPFRCSFCDVHTTQGRKLRLRSPEDILEEIKYNIEAFSIREFVFKDSTFTVNKRWVHDLLDRMLREKLRISWSVNTRVNLVDSDLVEKMKQAGCRRISFGVESGEPRILENIRKDISLDEVRKAFAIVRRSGLESHAFFMIGNPGEGPRSAHRTIQFAKEIGPTWADFSATVAYPGTHLFEEAVENGLLKDPLWYVEDEIEIFLTNKHSVSKGQLDLPGFSPKRQVETVRKAYRQFYLRPRWIWQFALKNMNVNRVKNILHNLGPFFRFLFQLMTRDRKGQ